jgi:succinate-semialdehyde dehydrogenase/glutarate-semialdehyde dehydrogenase
LQKVKNLKSGDPLDDETQIGVLANTKQADLIEDQVQSSVKAGAKILTGGEKNKAYYSPTVLTDVKPGMKVFDEETFGPVAAFIKANSTDEIFELSNNSGYGLGVSICTSDVTNALQFIDDIDDGAVFFNEIVKSDPRLPFGGTKQSGYGRELSKEGIHEFVNLQTIYIK